MTRRILRASVTALSSLIVALATTSAEGQAASPAPPDNPFADPPTASARTASEPAAEPTAMASAPRATNGAVEPTASTERARSVAVEPTASTQRARNVGDVAAPADDRGLVQLTATTPRVEPPPPPSEAFGALDDVLAGDGADPLAGMEPAAMEPAVEVEGAPSRAETAEALARVTPDLRACAREQSGRVVELRIVFAPNGRVTTATVTTQSVTLSPAQRSCVARAARRARIAAFERARFEIRYPVRF